MKSSNFFVLFQERSKFFLFNLAIFAIINSIWASTLLLTINNKTTGVPLPYFDEYDWIVYGVIVLVSFIFSAAFQTYMIKLMHNLGNEMGLDIFDKLRFASYEDFKNISEEKVRNALLDVKRLQNFPQQFIALFGAGVMLIIGIAYMFWINPIGGGFVVGSMILLSLIYSFRNQKIEEDLEVARDLDNIYEKNINDFLKGFREMKMSKNKSDNIFVDFISKNRNSANKLTIKSLIKFFHNELLGMYLWYVMIGLVLFLLPNIMPLNQVLKTNFLITLLFLIGPLGDVINLVNDFVRMRISLGRLNEFNQLVETSTAKTIRHGESLPDKFEKIVFEKVTYEYFDKDRRLSFQLNPIDLVINKGESIFITGGNGSGKSTFINLVTGLCSPKNGKIYLNNEEVSKKNESAYRDKISCIFTDNYLFNENYEGLELTKDNEKFTNLLKKMKLDEVVEYDEANNKIFHSLSKGQQKRMALIYALLEDKDIFIFDEWAAEQDPGFRKYFYEVIVPELKRKKKTLIAVTHDDAYFHCAERILKFDYGTLIEDVNLSKGEQLINSPEPVINEKLG